MPLVLVLIPSEVGITRTGSTRVRFLELSRDDFCDIPENVGKIYPYLREQLISTQSQALFTRSLSRPKIARKSEIREQHLQSDRPNRQRKRQLDNNSFILTNVQVEHTQFPLSKMRGSHQAHFAMRLW